MDKERQAVIVGVGRLTQSPLTPLLQCVTPVGMFTTAARRAAMDATPGSTSILRDCVAIASPGMFLEQRFFAQTKRRQYKNFSRSVANALGASPLPENTIRSYPGGNSPQFLMSMFAEKISKGEVPQGPGRDRLLFRGRSGGCCCPR